MDREESEAKGTISPNVRPGRSSDRVFLVRVVARAAAVLVPPIFLAHVIFAAPKAPPPPPPKKPPAPVVKGKDAGVADAPSASDAKGPTEKTFTDAKAASFVYDGEPGGTIKEIDKKEGDASIKVFTGGQSEIEGRSRWPAVTYFIRRLRAEFEAQKLPHRSFLPEMEATKGDPAVK